MVLLIYLVNGGRMSVYSNFTVSLDNPNSSWTIVYNAIADNSTILDIGCSSGYFDKILIDQKKCIVDGIELDKDDYEKAKKICRAMWHGNIEDSLFPWELISDKYDHILFIDVLEHLLDPSEALKKCARFLKPNGSIIFSIPNMGNGTVRLELLTGGFTYQSDGLLDATHLHYYTGSTIQSMIDRSGLRLSSIDYTTFNTPKVIIDKILGGVGLDNTEAFTRFINSDDSLVYQYVGQITTTGKSVKIIEQNGSVKPKIDYDKQLADIKKEASRQFKQKVERDQTIAEKDIEISELNKVIDMHNKKFHHKLARKISEKTRQFLKP